MRTASQNEATLNRPVGVYGHRGASLQRPENTLGAFALAAEQGADGIELDLALSAEGIPVIMHDATVDRTTNGTGDVRALTLVQLRALDAGSGEQVPTLEEVLLLAVQRGLEVNIEIKDAAAARAVRDMTRSFPELRWFASSFHWDTLDELRAMDSTVRMYPLTLGVATLDTLKAMAVAQGYSREQLDAETERFSHLTFGLDAAISKAVELKAEGISVWERDLTASDIAVIHAAGLQAWVWTINDPVRASELIAAGADAICTDDPAAILAVR